MGIEPDTLNASLRALTEAVYRNGMMTGGLGTIATDELHAYEEGMNADAARLYLNWGEPRSVERLMATARALDGVILPNPAGHRHFASNWYGAAAMYREGAWEWQKPYSFTVMHAPILLGLYNGSTAARSLVTGVVDGWMAHGVQTDGSWTYPNEINWRTDQVRAGDGGGATVPLQSAWAAWRFTGDARYLRPILSRVAKAPAALADFNENGFAALPEGAALRDRIAAGEGDYAGHARWQKTGDPAPLAAAHEAAAKDRIARRYMLTEGHWWSDRVEMDTGLLQRERLGGIALRRNQTWPGNTVSWRFDEPAAAGKVAILMPGATPGRFRVIGFNTTDRVASADMTGWNVTAGRWTMRWSTSPDGGRTLLAADDARLVTLERSASVKVHFRPGTTTVVDFELREPGEAVETRADLGIGSDDVVRRGRTVTVTIHSLGARATGGGAAALVDGGGTVIATAALPPLDAPADLRPRTARVRLTIPRGVDPATLAVRVGLPNDATEVTTANNRVPLR